VVLGGATAAYAAGVRPVGAVLGLLVAALALLSAVTGFCTGCQMYRVYARLRGLGRGRGQIEHVDPADFGGNLGQNTVVEFTHPLCSDCRRLERDLLESGRRVLTVDVRRSPELARKYGVGVVPTAVAVDGTGRVLSRLA
jgi:thiol-disulfide isomerase/thioredoxin